MDHGEGKKGYCPAWLQLQDEYKAGGQGPAQPLGSLCSQTCVGLVCMDVWQHRVFPYLPLLRLHNKGQA